MKHALRSGVLALGVVMGCGSSSDYGDAPDGASRQSSIDLEIGPAPPEVLLIVADDRADAEELRQLVQLEIESFATRSLGIAPACAAEEPTRKHPIDVSLVLVHPSAMGDARFAGPSTVPALRWQEADATQSGRLAWVSAARAALDETHSEGPFSALAAMKSAFELLDGKRTPDGAGESSLLGSLPSAARLRALFLAAHALSRGEQHEMVALAALMKHAATQLERLGSRGSRQRHAPFVRARQQSERPQRVGGRSAAKLRSQHVSSRRIPPHELLLRIESGVHHYTLNYQLA